MARVIWPAAAFVAFSLAGCSGDKPAETAESETKDGGPAIPVEVARPSRGDIYATYTGTAPIEAYQDANVIAKERHRQGTKTSTAFDYTRKWRHKALE